MRWKLLFVALWRHHRVATSLALAALLAAGAAVGWVGSSGDAPEAGGSGRRLLDRPWFERYPESSRDELGTWVWLAGGIGAYQQGSAWRGSFDVFEFERRGNAVDMRFLQDGEEARTDFAIERCDEAPPFDLCLTLRSSPRGPRRYYSFDDGDDFAAHLPWAADRLEEVRVRAARAR